MTTSGHPKAETKNQIARRFVIYIILLSSLITLVSSAVQLALDYRRDLAAIESNIKQIQTSHLQSLANSVWVEDEQQITSQLNGLVRYSDMEFLSISLNNRPLWNAGEKKSTRILEKRFPLTYQYRGKIVTIGQLHVIASIDSVISRLIDKAIVILVSNAIKTFIVSGFILLLFHYLVTRHLHTLGQWARTYNLTGEPSPLTLKHSTWRKTNTSDEIDAVVTAVNTMQDNISQAYKQLRKSHDNYEKIAVESQRRLILHLENTPLAAITWDTNFICVNWNKAAERIFGFSKAEAIGSYGFDLLVPHDIRAEIKDYFETLKNNSAASQKTSRNTTKNGKTILCRWFNTPLINNNGECIGVASLAEDVTEQKRIHDALVEAKENADFANKAKSEFLSHMSHELRTPLNAVIGFGQLLELDPESPLNNDQAEAVRHIVDAGRHLLQLINEVLDLSKIETGRLDIRIATIPLEPILKETQELISTLATKRNIRVILSDCPDIQIRADSARLKQALLNILSNAVKYNKEGGYISIKVASRKNNRLRITITDSGPGIPTAMQARLFEPFNRLGAEKTDIEGTGIGLSITKRFIEAMGGTIGLHSKPGEGSSFWIELEKSEQLKNTHPGITLSHENTNLTAGKHLDKILYIEDDPDNIYLMQNIIDKYTQAELEVAENVEQGLTMAVNEQPGLILMDIDLPGMNPLDAVRHLRQNKRTRHIAVIAISSTAIPEATETGLRAGFAQYLTIPIDIKHIVKIINEVLDSSKTPTKTKPEIELT